MKETKFTFRQLQRMTVKELEDSIPAVVTVNGHDVFLIMFTDDIPITPTVRVKPRVITKPADVPSYKGSCKHGSAFGLCKYKC